ncbi:MAG: cell envelope integrity protein TolA [Gammaproteobacteria bacterium]|nr:cell envelope integrity protein TolA [Gammaproteobacteria bacterium]
MWKEIREDPRALLYAVLVHAVLLLMLVLGLNWTPKTGTVQGEPTVVQAVAVNQNQVQAEVNRLKQEHQRRQTQAEQRLLKARQAREQEQQRLAKLKQQQAEQQRQREAQQKQLLVEQQRLAQVKKQQQLEAQRLAQLRKQKQQQEALEKKRQAQLAAKRKLEQEQAQKRQAELAAKRKQQQAEQRRAEQALQRQLAAEQQQRQAAQTQIAQATVDRYVTMIKQQVQSNWLRPATVPKGLSCTVLVHLIPSGDVISVQIVKSSGNPIFDRSVEIAVRRASPLPLPADPTLFDRFRELQFVFNPEG